jgi:hypothetical protein
MPEASQYNFSHLEVLELLVKKANLHEGKWQLIVNFTFGALNAGPSPSEVLPAGMVAVASLGITKAAPESPSNLTVDAKIVNPASTEKPQPLRRSRGVSRGSS